MKRFHYRALDSKQAVTSGHIEATSKQDAVHKLQAKGLMVLNIGNVLAADFALTSSRILPPALLANLTRQLATLMTAGQPLERALTTLMRQQKSKPVKALLERVLANVKDGKSFSAALEMENGQFSALYLSMVRAGEASGALNLTLQQLSDYLEQSHKLRAEFINALIYPAFLLVGVIGSVALLLTYVIPQFIPVFEDMNIEIPMITRMILALGQWSNQYGLYLFAGFAAAVPLVLAVLRNPGKRQRFDAALLHLPKAGVLLAQAETARVCRTLGTLLQNGVGLLAALKIVERVSRNHAIAAQLNAAHEQVKSGKRLSEALDAPRLLPDLALEMIEVGELSGELDSLLIKVAEIFDAETRHGLARFMAAFTPVLTVVMAVLVMGIMLAVMLPLMSLTNNI